MSLLLCYKLHFQANNSKPRVRERRFVSHFPTFANNIKSCDSVNLGLKQTSMPLLPPDQMILSHSRLAFLILFSIILVIQNSAVNSLISILSHSTIILGLADPVKQWFELIVIFKFNQHLIPQYLYNLFQVYNHAYHHTPLNVPLQKAYI